MIDSLLLHKRTLSQVNGFIRKPSHALLVTGGMGSGKNTLARAIAATLLDLKSIEQLNKYPYFTNMERPEGKRDIPIESVRSIIDSLKLRTPGKELIRRIIVIDGSESLSIEAQNALLKVLEEPPADTLIILTAPSVKHVLPTIASRSQIIEARPVDQTAIVDFYSNLYPDKNIKEAWALSGGNIGLTHALLDKSVEHPLKAAVNEVKKILAMSTYDRIIELDRISRDREALTTILDAFNRVLEALHRSAINKNQVTLVNKLTRTRKGLTKLQEELSANASPRLVALNLAIKLKI